MSCACRDASLEVQRPLWNEQGDNLKQSKKNTSSTCSFLFLFLHADIAQKRPAGVDIPILSVELELVPTSAFNSYKAQSTSANDRRLHACTRWLPWRSENDSQHFRDMTLQAPPPFFFLIFFLRRRWRKEGEEERENELRIWDKIFLLSIAQRIGSKPPPPDMKVLSFVRDVWNSEMTPKAEMPATKPNNHGRKRYAAIIFFFYINRSQKSVVANRLTSSHAGTSSSRAIASFSASSRRADSEKNLHGLINTENASLIIKSQNAIYYTKRRSAWCIVRETEVTSRLWCQNWRWTSSNFPLPRICFLRSTSLNMSPWNWHGKFTLSVAKNIRALCSVSLSRDEWSNNRRKLIECICMAAPSFFLSQKGINITPKANGNRKRDVLRPSPRRAQLLHTRGAFDLSPKAEPDQLERPGRAFDFAVLPVLSDPQPLEQCSNGSAPWADPSERTEPELISDLLSNLVTSFVKSKAFFVKFCSAS